MFTRDSPRLRTIKRLIFAPDSRYHMLVFEADQ